MSENQDELGTETVELDARTAEVVRAHQQDDETLSDAADRLLSAVPHPVDLQAADLDTEDYSGGRWVIARWPGEDNVLDHVVYPSPREFVESWADATGYGTTERERNED